MVFTVTTRLAYRWGQRLAFVTIKGGPLAVAAKHLAE